MNDRQRNALFLPALLLPLVAASGARVFGGTAEFLGWQAVFISLAMLASFLAGEKKSALAGGYALLPLLVAECFFCGEDFFRSIGSVGDGSLPIWALFLLLAATVFYASIKGKTALARISGAVLLLLLAAAAAVTVGAFFGGRAENISAGEYSFSWEKLLFFARQTVLLLAYADYVPKGEKRKTGFPLCLGAYFAISGILYFACEFLLGGYMPFAKLPFAALAAVGETPLIKRLDGAFLLLVFGCTVMRLGVVSYSLGRRLRFMNIKTERILNAAGVAAPLAAAAVCVWL